MKAVVLLSGGVDSTTLLYDAVSLHGRENVAALSVYYGQRHSREVIAARDVAAATRVRRATIYLSDALRPVFEGSTSALLNPTIAMPEGHYADESMKATIVPNRNMILISLAVAHAIALEATEVCYAAHSGDHPIYPDCRPAFVHSLTNAVARASDDPRVRLSAPYIGKTKADIVLRGLALGVDYSLTWSCYRGGDVHCGKCGTCVERREAFELCGAVDPVPYAAGE